MMNKIVSDPREWMYPNPVVLVSCGLGEEANIVTLAWAGTVCSRPPMVSISLRPATHSHGLLRRNGEFALNVPTLDLMEAVHICGIRSGRDCNKWALTGLHPDRSEKIATPGIAECPISLECRIRHMLDLGLHTLFIGEVLCTRKDPDWKTRALPPVFLENKYYALKEAPYQERR